MYPFSQTEIKMNNGVGRLLNLFYYSSQALIQLKIDTASRYKNRVM